MSDTPDHSSDLSQIFGEFLVRRQRGESPSLDDYCQRFPDFAEQLRQHVVLYDALEEPRSATDVRRSVANLDKPRAAALDTPKSAMGGVLSEEQHQRTANPQVLALLEEMFSSDKTPEEACIHCPELLPEVRRRLQDFYLINAQVEALFPALRADLGADAIGPGLPSAGLPQVPGYEVEALLGHGGMGVVYRATDHRLGREVAIKVLRARIAFDSGIARRFADEARITAQLQHPGIPPVHDLGTLPDGRPFLAMKLIKGQTLDALLASRLEPSAERGRFVAVFEQLCQAVAYAHAHGVIHRDLKPGNVMVGAFGEVQVMDWGLAKVLRKEEGGGRKEEESTDASDSSFSRHPSSFTLPGSVLGTLAFMAPEQAVGAAAKIDRRSDVFGLGAVLAVVLTGRPPFVAVTAEATRVMAARGDVGECFARLGASGADPDLVALCQRCLAPLPEDRPADAGEVANAVAALRAAAEERARRAELERVATLARAAEQQRRRRLLRAASGVIALVLLAGLSASLWQMRRAMQAEVEANTNAIRARDEANAKALALAAEQKARRQAFDALDSITTNVVERKFAQGAVLTEDDRAFLRGIIAQLQAFAAISVDDIDSRVMHAAGRLRVAGMRSLLGELKEAQQDYDEAVNLQKQLADDFPARPEFRRRLADGYNNRGLLLSNTGRPQEAEQDYDQALRIRQQLTTDFPARPEFRKDLASIHVNRGTLLDATGRLQEAQKAYDQAVELYQQLAADFPSGPEHRREMASSHLNRGILLRATGKLKEAENDFRLALSIQKQLAADFPSRAELRRDIARSHLNRGNLLYTVSRLRDAEKDYDQAVSIYKQLAADFPSVPEYRHELASCLSNRGILLRATGRLPLAEKDYDQVLSLSKQLAADFPSRPEFRHLLATSHNNRGLLLYAVGRLPEAEKDYAQAVSLYKQLAADFPSQPDYRQDLSISHNGRGILLNVTGRLPEAEKEYDQAVRIQKQLAADFPSRPEFRQKLATSHNNRGLLLQRMGRLQEAEKDYDQALSIQKRLAAEFPSRPELREDLARSHNNRGIALDKAGRPQEAEKDYDQALSIQKQLAAEFPNQPDRQNELAATCVNRAILHEGNGNWAAAKELLLAGRPHHLAALKASPLHPTYRQFYRNHLAVLPRPTRDCWSSQKPSARRKPVGTSAGKRPRMPSPPRVG